MTDVPFIRIQNTDMTVRRMLDLMERAVLDGFEVYMDGDTCAVYAKGARA